MCGGTALCSVLLVCIYISELSAAEGIFVPLDFTWSAPLLGTPQKRSVLQTPPFSEAMQPDCRVSVTFPKHWEPLENETNQISGITIPEVQLLNFWVFIGLTRLSDVPSPSRYVLMRPA